LKEDLLKLEVKKKTVKEWKEGSSEGDVRFGKIGFDITFDNRNSTSVGPMTLEYKIFTRPAGRSKDWDAIRLYMLEAINFSKTIKPVLYKKEEISALAPRSKKVFQLGPAPEMEEQMNSNYVDATTRACLGVQKFEVEGIWIRLTMQKDGKTEIREILKPESLKAKYSWDD
jgi:hypothetical protein